MYVLPFFFSDEIKRATMMNCDIIIRLLFYVYKKRKKNIACFTISAYAQHIEVLLDLDAYRTCDFLPVIRLYTTACQPGIDSAKKEKRHHLLSHLGLPGVHEITRLLLALLGRKSDLSKLAYLG